jgi:3-hydroxybutyryl-CoA dehydrogenase
MTAFKQVAVLGAGTMGHGIALVHALGGCAVRLQDAHAPALERAPSLIQQAADMLVGHGGLDRKAAIDAIKRIEIVADAAAAVRGVDLVVEAVVEDPAVKREVFAIVDAAAPESAAIASNTSSLDVFPLIPARRLKRSLVVHWYMPPYIIDLVDVVGGEETDPGLLDTMKNFLVSLGKRPVVLKRFITGYIANRLQAALAAEIYMLLDEGYATAQDIDDSVRYGLAERMALFGHLSKSDYTGLELLQRILALGTYEFPPPKRHSKTLDGLIAQGRTGVMSGAGFFDYGGQTPAELLGKRDRQLLALKHALRRIEREVR